MKILFVWAVNDELKEYFRRELEDIAELIFPPSREIEDILPLVGDVDIIVGWAVQEELLNAARTTKLLIIPAIGVDFHIETLKKFPNIEVCNSHGNAEPTAQHAVALLLSITNRIVLYDQRMRRGHWRAFSEKPPSLLTDDLTIGVLGTGTIGRHFMRLMSGFNVNFVACSRRGRPVEEFPNLKVYTSKEIDGFLHQSNVLLVAIPRTKISDGMIGKTEIEMLPDDPILINVARGSIVQEESLYQALKSRRIAWAGLDVWYDYRPVEAGDGKRFPYHYPFHELENVVLSPHRGGSPLTRPKRFEDIVDNIHRYHRGEPLRFQIDTERGY